MRMDKQKGEKAFTLAELLAVLVILAILLGLTFPAIRGYMNMGTKSYYHGLENNVLASGKDFISDYNSLYPKEIGNTTIITIEELVENKYIDPPKDEDGNICDGAITIIKTGKNSYEYKMCLKCGNNYQSDPKNCDYTGNNNISKNYAIKLNGDLPARVNQGIEITVPTATVTETQGDQSKIIDNNLKGIPKTIDTTVLGSTTVTWTYRTKKISKTIEVVDSVAPTIESLELKYTSGTSYEGGLTNKDLALYVGAKDYACPVGSECRNRHPNLEGSGIKSIQYKEKNATKWITYNTTKKKTTIPIKTTLVGQIQVRVIDNVGNVSAIQTLGVELDKTPPSKTIVTYVSGSSSPNWQNNIKIKLSATDNMTIKYFEIYKDGVYYGTTGENWIPPNNFSSNNVTFRAVDVSGNKGEASSVQKIHMDTEPPGKPAVNLNGYVSNTWTNKDVKQTFTATDNVKVSYYEYANSNTATTGTKITNPWILNQVGEHTLYVRAVDLAGNKGPWSNSYNIKIDKTPPSKTNVTYQTGSSSTDWQNDIKIKLSSTDNVSIKHYEIYVDGSYYGTTGENWTPPNGFSSNNVTFRAVDVSGNKGSFSAPQKIHMDTERPTHIGWQWGNVTSKLAPLYIQTSDNASGIDRVQCKVSTQTGGYTNWKWFDAVFDTSSNRYRCDITPPTFGHYDQIYQVQLYIYDKVGNGGYYNQTTVKIPPSAFKLAQVARPGDYVRYQPSSAPYVSPDSLNGHSNQTFIPSSYTGLWQILYNNNTFGLEITSSSPVAQIYLRGRSGYNNIYDTLNNLSKAYMDNKYAISARHIGTNPSNPTDPSGWCTFKSQTIKCNESSVWHTDRDGLIKANSQNPAGIFYIDSTYWLVSRQTYGDDPNEERLCCVTDSRYDGLGNGSDDGLGWSDRCPLGFKGVSFEREQNYEVSDGVRPVIKLSADTMVTGSGTLNDPFVIEY